MPESVFVRPDQLGTEEEVAANASAVAQEIFGFGFLKQNLGGRNGYKTSYHMGTDLENYGFFAIGGKRQNETVCFNLTGVGLTAAFDGWETRLYEFIKNDAPTAKITRVDLAHDFLEGQYNPEWLLKTGKTADIHHAIQNLLPNVSAGIGYIISVREKPCI